MHGFFTFLYNFYASFYFNGKYYSEGDKNLTSMLNFMLNFFLYIAKRTDHFILLSFFLEMTSQRYAL